ncbi:MAG TPA: glycosyltransferase family A protein [Vicinamibacterales bacterium]|nr:glycosyltransferase family A protein [Vicinamibacterales bacterium]
MKVTVAMPAYNAAAFINEAVESVLAQDCDSFELLIVDDGSRDATWRQLRKYEKHENVRLFRNGTNRGAGATRNRLLSLARGRYVTPCDADDLLLPGALRRLSDYLDSHPRIGVVYGAVLELMTDGKSRVVRPPMVHGKDAGDAWDLIENPVNHAGSMGRTALVRQVGGYDEAVYSVDDWSLWMKLAEVARFKYLRGEVYYLWRRHPRSLTQTDPNWHRDVGKIRDQAIQRRYGVDAPRRPGLQTRRTRRT